MRFIISQYNIHFNGFIFTYNISIVSVMLMQFPWFQLDLHVHYFHCFSNSKISMVSALCQVYSFKFSDMVNVLKFPNASCLLKKPRQTVQTQIRLLLKRSSLIRVFPVCYSDKYSVSSSPENKAFYLNTEIESVRNFITISVVQFLLFL